jgi:hypothetical protein
MKKLLVLAGLLLALPAVAQNQAENPNIGAIYGTVITQEELPAKGLILNALPLGVVLGMALPWTKTDDAGAFRFEHLPLGRYTVFAEDEAQGYSQAGTGTKQGNPIEVELTAEHPEAESNLRLPPKGGFLRIDLTNQKSGAVISAMGVKVMSAGNPPKWIFSRGYFSNQPLLVPSDENLLIHVTSDGFREWDRSAGNGKLIRIAPGDSLTLDVQLEPANRLRARIPDADPEKYRGVHDAKDWKNPYLIVRAEGIEITAMTGSQGPIPVESVAAALEKMPDWAWPYGLDVAVEQNDTVAAEGEPSRIETNRTKLFESLEQLGVMVGVQPSSGCRCF